MLRSRVMPSFAYLAGHCSLSEEHLAKLVTECQSWSIIAHSLSLHVQQNYNAKMFITCINLKKLYINIKLWHLHRGISTCGAFIIYVLFQLHCADEAQ